MIKKRRFFKKKPKSKKYRTYNKFFSYKSMDRRKRNFLYKDFSNSSSYNTKFNFSIFRYCKFYKAKIKACSLNGCIIEWTDFKSTNFNHTRFNGTIFKNVYFGDCKLNTASFKNAIFENVVFKNSSYQRFKNIKGTFNEKELKNIDIECLKSLLNEKFNILLNDQDLRRLILEFDEKTILEALNEKKPVKISLSYIAKIVNEYKKRKFSKNRE